MDLNESLPDAPDVTVATSWAFYFEGERYFEGFREFFTAENVELPILNGYRVLGRLGNTRLTLTSDATWDIARLDELPGPSGVSGAGPSFDPSGGTGSPTDPVAPASALSDVEVDGLAALGKDAAGKATVGVVLWHHVDDQYASAPPAEVSVELRNLPFPATRAQVRHWRIDATHSNAFTAWQAMGRPQDPTPEQLAVLKSRQGLEEGGPVKGTSDGADTLRLRFPLPLHAVSLLEVHAG